MKRGSLILSLVLVSVLVISGCNSEMKSSSINQCRTDEDCNKDEVCSKGYCTENDRGIGDPFTCGGYTCYEDGDAFTDHCLDSNAVPPLCGECWDDAWCTQQYPGSTCQYGVECGCVLGDNCEGLICNECYAPGQFECGEFICYDDGDDFTDSCIDVASGTCGECVNDDSCGGEGYECIVNTRCDYGEGPCNECVCAAELGNPNDDYNDDDTPIFNVLDIVILANCVLVENCGLNPDGSNAGNDFIENGCATDLNGDTAYNVLDIVILANCVLATNCGG